MTQSATRIANVKWNISAPPDFDEATRIYLASQGGKKRFSFFSGPKGSFQLHLVFAHK